MQPGHSPAPTQGRGASSASNTTPILASGGNGKSSAALSAALKGATLAFQAQNKAAGGDRPAPVTPKPSPSVALAASAASGRAGNGALRAATQAAAREGSRSRQRSPAGSRHDLSRQLTGGSVAPDLEHGLVVQRLSQHLVPAVHQTPDARASASYIAATLAASRTGSPTPSPSTGFAQAPLSATQLHSRVPRRPSLGVDKPVLTSPGREHGTDADPIQPTGSLISLFESKKEAVNVDPVKKRDPAQRQQHAHAQLPSKGRPMTPPRTRSPEEGDEERQQEPKPRTKPEAKPKPVPSVVVRAATFKESKGPDEQPRTARGSPHPSPKSIVDVHARETTPPAVRHERRPVAELISPEPRRVIKTPQLEPPQLPPRRSAASSKRLPRRALSQSSASSDDSFVSASSTQSPRAMSLVKDFESPSPSPNRHSSSSPRRATQAHLPSPSPIHPSPSPGPRFEATRRLTSPNTSSPSSSSLALDSLTNAIVASNLASARLAAQSSSPAPPQLPAPRRHQHRPRSPQHLQPQRTADSLQRDRTGGSSRSPGARQQQQDPKQRTGMLRTLRAPHSSHSDDEDARRRTHRTRKKTMHPLSGGKKHAHNEGSRRRWRDEVSARERRRYEAVWASNRGLFLRPGWASGTDDGDDDGKAREGTPQAGLVVNVVVRDIWSRSRLPVDELAEVWDLVDKRGDGTLGRQEFVVGMWLIDQRLRGRKIPARVGESVWASVRGGLTVPGPKRK
ncbi:hypothetical protein B0T16DRAFT_412569 [Cercophora newfieldiana]|uniref:EH domain-containing protein n=1 Tax=Cercophora newfieldiana TaxID=92897 RepID=A0AA40CQS7_9PEZI|nr:hypothetical protein B0T16DRAFT_412569 [Cercophora newfieldiana]